MLEKPKAFHFIFDKVIAEVSLHLTLHLNLLCFLHVIVKLPLERGEIATTC
jgi:hypothetical protein